MVDLGLLTSADAPFWRSLEEGSFRLPRCSGCARWMWPPEFRCGGCGAEGLDWVDVPARGTVYSWTRTHYPFVPERAGDLPYTVVLVEVAEAGGARLLGVLEGDEAGLRIGAPVTGRIAPASAESRGFPTVRWSLTTTEVGR